MRRSSTRKAPRRLLLHEKRLNSSGYTLIAGVDEAGRGPLAGPVVAGAVILRHLKFKAEVDDSKKLSPKKREKAYREIMKKAIVGIGVVDEKVIDRINIYRATIKAMEIAVAGLKIPPDYLLVDGRMNITARCPVRCIVRGDSNSLSIAAASIIAKVTRDRLMLKYHDLYPEYNFARHKGYPTKLHKMALEKHGPSPIHRFSFQPVKRAQK